MDETTKTGMLIASKSSRVCSNRGGLIRKYGVWNIYIWTWPLWEFGNSLADGNFFLVLDEHLQTVLPWEGPGHRFRQGSFFTRFYEDMGFQKNKEENKAAQVCRHLTTHIFISIVPLKKSRFRCRLFFSIHSCSRCPLRARRFGSNHGRDSIYLSFPRWGMDGNGKNGTKKKRKGEIS